MTTTLRDSRLCLLIAVTLGIGMSSYGCAKKEEAVQATAAEAAEAAGEAAEATGEVAETTGEAAVDASGEAAEATGEAAEAWETGQESREPVVILPTDKG